VASQKADTQAAKMPPLLNRIAALKQENFALTSSRNGNSKQIEARRLRNTGVVAGLRKELDDVDKDSARLVQKFNEDVAALSVAPSR
jgi:hypothetical protein